MKRAALIAVPLLFAACAGGSASGAHTASPVAAVASPISSDAATASASAEPSPDQSPITTPTPVAATYGIVVKDFLVDGGATYTISLIRDDGGLQATATANKRSHPKGFLVQQSSISASNSRVYYLDGDSRLNWLLPDGSTGMVKALPVDENSAAIFAVSPDDSKIAVAIITYPFPVKTRIYIEDLYGTGNHVELFSSSTAMEWPVGWDQGRLVIGVGTNAAPQNAWEGFDYTHGEYHLVNAATGVRLATICANGISGGPPTPAGTVCRTSSTYSVLSWTGAQYTVPTGNQCGGGVLSPDGQLVADRCLDGEVRLVTAAGGTNLTGYTATPLGWIDRLRVVIMAPSGQLSILYANGIIPIDATGFFGGTVPGSL